MPPYPRISFGGITLNQAPAETKEQQLERERDYYRGRLETAMREPKMSTYVIEVDGDVVHLDAGDGKSIELPMPKGERLEVGDMVKVLQGRGIIGKHENPLPLGLIATVKQVIDARTVEVQIQMQAIALPFRGEAPKPGDRVVLNRTQTVVLKNLGAGDTSKNVAHETGVEWDDVGGQDEAKRALREAIEEPILKPGVYKRFGMRAPRGVLLHGEPGCGKTLLGKAAATALARLHGVEMAASGFIYVKGPELLDKFVGETEANIRKIFAQAREHHAKSGYPAVIFIDECDAVLGKRGARAPGFEGMERTVIPQFLSEMDGMFESGAFVLLATNRPDVLDGAVVRDGRIDRKVHVKRPDVHAAADILERLLVKRPIDGGARELSVIAARELFASSHVIAVIRCKGGDDKRFTLGDVASGAILAGLVERATQRAIRRAIAGDEEGSIVRADLEEAVKEVAHEQREIDQDASLRAFCEPFAERVVKIEKADKDSSSLIIMPGRNVLQ